MQVAVQSEQLVTIPPADHFPAAHASQADPVQYCPAAHSVDVHSDTGPPGDVNPSGHFRQVVPDPGQYLFGSHVMA